MRNPKSKRGIYASHIFIKVRKQACVKKICGQGCLAPFFGHGLDLGSLGRLGEGGEGDNNVHVHCIIITQAMHSAQR